MEQMNRFIEITKTVDNITQVYRYYFDEVELSNLLDEIIQNCSYGVRGQFKVPYDAEVDLQKQKIVKGATLPNGKPLFINIERLYPFSSHSGLIHYDNDSVIVDGTKVCISQLAYIISEILSDNPEGIRKLEDYSKSSELSNGQYLLRGYYQRLCELIKVGLVRQTEVFKDIYSQMDGLNYVSTYEVDGNEKRCYRYYYEEEAINNLLEIMRKKIGLSQLACITDRILRDEAEGIQELEIYPQRDEYTTDVSKRYYVAIKCFIYPKICVRREITYSVDEVNEKLYKLFLKD